MTNRGGFWSYLCSTAMLCALIFVIGVTPMWAQTSLMGAVSGVVTDPSGAVVPGVTATLTDTATKEQHTAITNDAGRYVFVDLPPSKYDMTLTKTGFVRVFLPSLVLQVGNPLVRNVSLQVGSQSTTVEVQTTGVEVQTMNATIGNTVSGLSLDSLPSVQRESTTFLTLQPGISPDGSVAGTVVDNSTFQLDGGNNTNDMDGSMSVYTPSYAGDPTGGVANQSNGVAAGATGVMPTPIDSVQEFKVNTANQGADFASSSGAQVQMVTRRGTDAWHGSVYEYYLDNNFSANTWQNNFTGTPAPNFHYSRFGARIGGPIIPKKILGGKTYFFANYQGFRWPNADTIERAVPSAAMRLGLLQFGGQVYNLNPTPVTYNGVSYAPAQCPAGACDPRGIGINPTVQQLWNKYMPLSNESGCGLSRCDGLNIVGYKANIAIPQNDNFGVARIDHDFGDKWHFMSSYRYYKLTRATTDQVDIGGFFSGDTLGTPVPLSNRPQEPWYLVAGLTTNISSNFTNDFRYSYLRNWWAWSTHQDPPQLAGLGGALEPGGESATQALIPYNVNTQQTRTRFWDGHDNMFRDDLTLLHGNHMFQFGGMYQHNWNYHQRTDNGGGINYQTVYQMGTSRGAGITTSGYVPATIASSDSSTWGRDYASMLGIVSVSQIAYTRSGPSLTLNPPNTPASDRSTIPYYNVYFGDTWHMKPRFTLTYGLGWTVEMPPVEANGKQIALVDANDHLISESQYITARQQAALQGQVFNPEVGFTLIGNVAGHPKYPYNPYYGEVSPRLAGAFDVFGDGSTVIRGGFSRIYGRLNGVDLVLVPLLGTGLIQPVQCFGALSDGTCATSSDPTNAFRVGVDGLVAPLPAASKILPQPLFPGYNGIAAGAGEVLDPHFRPNVVNTITASFQRQLNSRMSMELGYIGRFINNEYMGININSVPHMMTKGGQTFAKAYANLVMQYCGGITGLAGNGCNASTNSYKTVTPQPFFETALAGTGYCNGFTSCTAAVAFNEGAANGTGNLDTQSVWSLYSDLDSGGFNFPRSMMNTAIPGQAMGAQGQLTSGVGMNSSIGYGNYNALFVTLKSQDWKGFTMQSNFTWSKALGTGAVVQATSEATAIDPFNLRLGYGLQAFDRPIVYNLFVVYQPPYFKKQQGVVGHLLGGWTIAPIFTAGSGLPMTLGTVNGGGQAFGEGDSVNFFGYGNSENAIPITPFTKEGSRYSTCGSGGIGTSSDFCQNIFANPQAAWMNVRQPILGFDTHDGGWGIPRGMPYWNVDLQLRKQFNITERVNTEFQVIFLNVFNHDQFLDPSGDYLDTSNPAGWGTLPGQNSSPWSPRSMEFGVRVNF